MPPMDLETKTEPRESKLSIIMFILLFFAVTSIVVLVYLKSQNIDIKNLSVKSLVQRPFNSMDVMDYAKTTDEFNYDYKEHSLITIYKNYIIKCSKDRVIWLSRDGKEQKVKSLVSENPVLKSAGDYILIADIGGEDIYVINGTGIRWTRKIDSTIVNADIGNNGVVSIVKEKKGYKGAIDVFDPQGNLIFTTVRGGAFILSSKVLSSENKILINSVDTTGISASTHWELVNMKAEPASKPAFLQNVIFPSVWDLNGNNIIGVSDNKVVSYTLELDKKWGQEFTGVYCSSIALGKYIILAVAPPSTSGLMGRNATEIKILSNKGEEVATYELSKKIINMETSGNIIALNTGDQVFFINTQGKLVGNYDPNSDVVRVRFFNRREVMIQTKNSIITLKI